HDERGCDWYQWWVMPTRPRWSAGALIVVFMLGTFTYVACGARSDLAIPQERGKLADAGPDADPDAEDASPDVPEDVQPDIPPDAPPECEEDVTYVYVVTGS